MLRKNWVSLLS